MVNLAFQKKFKLEFFDSRKLMFALDKGTKQALSKFAGTVRKTAKQSMPKRKKSSAPGQPPSSHVGTLRKMLFYSWDKTIHGVVIGPVPFKKGIAPNILEFGGTEILIKKKRGRKVRSKVDYEPRPFMGPALDKHRKMLPSYFKDCVRGS